MYMYTHIAFVANYGEGRVSRDSAASVQYAVSAVGIVVTVRELGGDGCDCSGGREWFGSRPRRRELEEERVGSRTENERKGGDWEQDGHWVIVMAVVGGRRE